MLIIPTLLLYRSIALNDVTDDVIMESYKTFFTMKNDKDMEQQDDVMDAMEIEEVVDQQ